MNKPLCVKCYTSRRAGGYKSRKNITLLLHAGQWTRVKCVDCGEYRIVWGWVQARRVSA